MLLLAAAVVGLLTAAAALAVAARASWADAMATAGQELAPLVELVAALGLAGVLGWLGLAVLGCVVQVLRGRARPRFAPAVVHRLVCLVLGVSLGLAPVAAHAAPAAAAAPRPAPVSTSSSAPGPSGVTDPGWGSPANPSGQPGQDAKPESATVPPVPPMPPATGDGWVPAVPDVPPRQSGPDPIVGTADPRNSSADRVVVVRGDSLWEIAARHLGPQATAAEIAMEWPRWHRANADVIGADPDLILPGQQLVPPG